jgi:tagaturonate reductase
LQSLNRSFLAQGTPRAEFTRARAGKRVRVLQIGDGNFLRGFADAMIDVANGAGLLDASISIVQPLARGIARELRDQGCLFTVLLRGIERGGPTESTRIVSAVDEALDPYTEWQSVLARAADPALRFVISNTTEAGITLHEEPFIAGQTPVSFPAKVTALLHARFAALGGRIGSGLVFLPCELIERNGEALRSIVLEHAEAWQLSSEFTDWVRDENLFLNTLVDRIVPGYPGSEAEALFDRLGYRDPLLVSAEPFHLWVIEGPPELERELPLPEAGLNVIFTSNLSPYRTRKVRILNGAHTASALASYLAGLDTVREMTEDPLVSRFLRQVVFDEIVPFVPLPDAERRGYADTILERFANPFIRHELISIALNSISKWQVRVLPTLEDYVAERGRPAPGLAFSLAALIRFYRGSFTSENDFVGERSPTGGGGTPYPIRDDRELLAFVADAWRGVKQPSDLDALTRRLLSEPRLWGKSLERVPGLSDLVSASLRRIEQDGMRAALSHVVETPL